MASVQFFSQSLSFQISSPRKTASWLKSVIAKEKHRLVQLNFIFCTDEELHAVNVEYLDHDTYTDIITFDNSERQRDVEGDIFISIERVRENAEKFKVDFEVELRRVLVHGVLHLVGFRDKTRADRATMRKKEDRYLSLYFNT